MKRIAIFGVHFGYWVVYFLFTALFLMILSATGTPEAQKAKDALIQFYWTANVIPSLLGFYLFYYFVFFKIKTRAKLYKIVLTSLGFCLSIGLISTAIFRFSHLFKTNVNHYFDLEVIVFYSLFAGSIGFEPMTF